MPRTTERSQPTKTEDMEGKAAMLLSVFVHRTVDKDAEQRGKDTKTSLSSSSSSDCKLPVL